jgi:hypothetical protein
MGTSTKPKCDSCAKSVYPADPQVAADDKVWHRECFKCTACKGQLSLTTWAQISGTLYCKPHFVQMFQRA